MTGPWLTLGSKDSAPVRLPVAIRSQVEEDELPLVRWLGLAQDDGAANACSGIHPNSQTDLLRVIEPRQGYFA